MIDIQHRIKSLLDDLGLAKAPSLPLFVKLFVCLIVLPACVEQSPPPEPQTVPTATSGDLILIGIESSLAALEPIVANVPDPEGFVLISGSRQDLLARVSEGELDGAFVYQKPVDSQLWSIPIALDSLTIVTHPGVGIAGLNRPQLQQLFSARVKDWSAVGGPSVPPRILVLDPESGLHSLLNDRILENRPVGPEALVAPNPLGLQASVAETSGSLGYLPTSLLDPRSGVQPLAVDGWLPQSNTVQSQQYPLSIPVYLATPAEPQGELRRLAAWLQSAEGEQQLGIQFVLLPR